MKDLKIKYDQNGFDSIGRVFTLNDKVYRKVYNEYLDFYNIFFESDCWKKLKELKLFPDTSFSDIKIDYNTFVLEHDKINIITYPNEWTFDMLKDAALTTLKVLEILDEFGYTLKDGHPNNLLFDGCRPKFIDFGSIVIKKNQFWNAKNEFLKSFYIPLKIWSYGYEQLANLLLTDETSRCTNQDHQLILNSIINDDKVFILKKRKKSIFEIEYSVQELINLTKNLKNINSKNEWGEYHNEYFTNNKTTISTDRFDKIISIIDTLKVESILDIASNQGVISFLISERCKNVKKITCLDYDSEAINKCYLKAKENSNWVSKINVAKVDFILMQSLYFQKDPQIRFSSECLLVLALTHHLILSQHKYDLELILNKLHQYTSKYLLIEFMPLGLWNGKSLPEIPSWYTEEWFTNKLEFFFKIDSIIKLEINRILFVCVKKW